MKVIFIALILSIIECRNTKFEKPSVVDMINDDVIPIIKDLLPSKQEMKEWWIENMAKKPRVDRSPPICPTTGE